MKKIMFSDQYSLTLAVLEGRKTMTRRLLSPEEQKGLDSRWLPKIKYNRKHGDFEASDYYDDEPAILLPEYRIGEEIAVAQSYEHVNKFFPELIPDWLPSKKDKSGFVHWDEHPGYKNKMFVNAEYMPHRIRITNIRVEQLLDITAEDCLREGIEKGMLRGPLYTFPGFYSYKKGDIRVKKFTQFPEEAFQELFDRICGRGTCEKNPWVFVYEFELITTNTK